PSTVVSRAPTQANRAFLAASFLREVEERYGGSRLGRQELEGLLLEDVEGSLFPQALIERCRTRELPAFSRVVVAVDPAVSGHAGSDLCGIVVVGAVTEGPVSDWRAVVLEDASLRAASPTDWARAAIAAMQRHGAE